MGTIFSFFQVGGDWMGVNGGETLLISLIDGRHSTCEQCFLKAALTSVSSHEVHTTSATSRHLSENFMTMSPCVPVFMSA